ncbi:CocE/NonD hydrolase [Moelleriella libera RCEF 2490]|uniref:CocE/NonD hydrolase n=1 Tax=Moelleriella libera RCEF 2490 TaxID=1081109 RepID=A0A167WJP1_9HYPO|nr:CocE/NonD hydrolase [Moelleriella libera RCEF 2490]
MPEARGIVRWAVDRAAAWYWGLTAERCSYTVETLRIPIGGDIHLLAQLYQPISGAKPPGTVVAIGPYGRNAVVAVGTVRLFASRGYQGLLVSVRGTFGSGGAFDAGSTNTVDTQAVVSWMQRQPWYSGAFAMVGVSYLGLTQWATLENQPPDMAAAVIAVGPHDLGQYVWGTGALNLDLLTWANLIAHQDERGGFVASQIKTQRSKNSLQSIFTAVPLADAAERYLEGRTPWLRDRIERADLADPFWKPMKHEGAVERATLPILLVSGWQDVFLDQTMAQYRTLQRRGVPVALTVGPWHHAQVYSDTVVLETYRWIEQHLGQRPDHARDSPVRFYVTGANEWRNSSVWPPPPLPTTPREFFLGPETLSDEKPSGTLADSRFTFAPDDPTPAVGGPRLSHSGIYTDNALEKRDDVLIFASAPLASDVEMLGRCSVELAHSSGPHADLFVRISDVHANGTSRYVTETYRRLDPDRLPGDAVRIDFPDCAHRFKTGHSVRLIIAGGNYPHYLYNTGTGDAASAKPVTHFIHHAEDRISKLTLPVVT